MDTQGCYRDVLQWKDLGATRTGCRVLYKRYYAIADDFRHQAQYDVELNRSFWLACNGGFILTVDVGHSRRSSKAIEYARLVDSMSDPSHSPVAVHVVNAPRWVRVAWRVLRRFLRREIASTVHFRPLRDDQFASDEQRALYTDMCRR